MRPRTAKLCATIVSYLGCSYVGSGLQSDGVKTCAARMGLCALEDRRHHPKAVSIRMEATEGMLLSGLPNIPIRGAEKLNQPGIDCSYACCTLA